MNSAIFPARENLYGLLAGNRWDGEQPQVSYGVPFGYEEQDVVALGAVEDATHEEVALGAGRQEESFVLLVEIKVYDPAGEAIDVDRRAWGRADEVRTVVHTAAADDRNLRGAVRTARVTGMTSTGAVPAATSETQTAGWVSFVTVRIFCAVRIP